MLIWVADYLAQFESGFGVFKVNKRGKIRIHIEEFSGVLPGVTIVEGIWPNEFFLDKLGINSKLQEANTQAAKDLSAEFNLMLEETTGVEAFKKFSPATARRKGADIGKYRWWLPPGAQHFLTLNYKFFGKVKKVINIGSGSIRY